MNFLVRLVKFWQVLADLKNHWLIFDEAAEKYCFGSRITVQMDKWFHQDPTVVNCSRCWLKVFRGTLCHCRAMAVHLKFCDITLSVDCAKCKSGLKRFRDKTYEVPPCAGMSLLLERMRPQRQLGCGWWVRPRRMYGEEAVLLTVWRTTDWTLTGLFLVVEVYQRTGVSDSLPGEVSDLSVSAPDLSSSAPDHSI